MTKILLVEDDRELSGTLQRWLLAEKFIVDAIADGIEALERLALADYDLIILDWGLPEMSGVEVCKTFRSRGGRTPVIMLTARRSIDEKELGLDSGADDYLTKPFELRELSARIRAALRRASSQSSHVLAIRDVTMDTAAHKVLKNGRELKLMPKEYALLEFLLRYPNTVFSADALIERVWPTDSELSPDMIRNYVSRIRDKVDTPGESSIISTVHGVGYRLDR